MADVVLLALLYLIFGVFVGAGYYERNPKRPWMALGVLFAWLPLMFVVAGFALGQWIGG